MSTPLSCVTRTRGKHLGLQALSWAGVEHTPIYFPILAAMQDQPSNPFWKRELLGDSEKLSWLWKSHLPGTGEDNCAGEPQDYTAKGADEVLLLFLL